MASAPEAEPGAGGAGGPAQAQADSACGGTGTAGTGTGAGASARQPEEGADPDASAEQTRDAGLPWTGAARTADIICLTAIMLSGVYYLVLLAFRASLVGTHPLVLVLLNGSTEGIVSAAAFARVDHGSLAVVLLAAVPGLMKFDPFYWWAGRLWGERYIMLLSGRRNRGSRYMALVQRWGRWFTWPVMVVSPFLPIPSAIFYVVVGWAGMSLVTFVVLDIISSLLWAGMLAWLGYALGHHAVAVAQGISRYGLWITLAIVVVIIVVQVTRSRARAPRARAH